LVYCQSELIIIIVDINYGTLLYHRGVKKNEEKQKQIVEKKKEKLEELSKECTFTPDLNRISRQIMSVNPYKRHL